MSALVTSWVRTVVPALWATAIAWLVARIPAVAQSADQLNGLADQLLVPVVLAVVYAVLRRIEPHLPDWLTRIFLGSATPPTYPPTYPPTVADRAATRRGLDLH